MNEIIKIIVTYNAKEILIELENKDFDVFDSFIKLLSEKTGEQNIINNFELMPLNTSMPYILIDENNFKNIIDEKIENDNLKLFMNRKEINIEEENDDDIIFNNKNNKIKKNNNNDNEDDFSDNEEEKEIINNKENNINKEIVNDSTEKKFNENGDDEMIENLNIKNEINIKKELDEIIYNYEFKILEKNKNYLDELINKLELLKISNFELKKIIDAKSEEFDI